MGFFDKFIAFLSSLCHCLSLTLHHLILVLFFCLSIKAGRILKALLAGQFLLPYSILQVFMLLLALHLYPATIFLS